ncbi:DUF928 domain-containing protein [Nostoc sp. 2RC]|uniref:DUF928 domain-containing protein n=1 Tax=Nostoc sp. 2RC TaxID=2485484 RepID=UPI0016297E95|nr:DUF928 domain-containing protein [Nostoc sp. 2RC]MBC1240938.1 DUF928 domain-containing protein [Nostoc sp. 2RC]
MGTSLVNKNIYEKIQKSKSLIYGLVSKHNSKIHQRMDDKNKFLHQVLYTLIFTNCILSLILVTIQAALAGYQPPKDQKPPSGYSDSSGVRGTCSASSSPILLAPMTYVGLTTSTHPTFAWFVVDNQSVPIEFSLYEFDTNLKPKKLDRYTQTFLNSSGLIQRSLSKDLPGLSVGKRYLWQLQSLCDPYRPSHNLITRAEIEVVALPQTLFHDLAITNESSYKANLYGKYGIWYDAIKEVLPSNSKQKLNKVFIDLLASLAKSEQSVERQNLTNIAFNYGE